MLRGINVAMSVFWSSDGEINGALSEPDAHMSCLWPVDDDGQTKATKVQNGARALNAGWFSNFLAIVVGLLIVS